MEFRYLQSFITLAEELHFTRASIRLNLSQPALSHQISTLEQSVDAELFDRSRRRVSLTLAGQAFLPMARGILDDWEKGLGTIRHIASGKARFLRVGYASACMPRFLARTIRSYREACPDMAFELIQMSTNEQVQALRVGDIDVAALHPPIDETGLKAYDVCRDPMWVALFAKSLPVEETEVHFESLRDLPLVIFPRMAGPHLFDSILAAYAKAGVSPDIQQRIHSWHSALYYVGTGPGVAFVPETFRDAHPTSVRVLPLAQGSIELPYALATEAHVSQKVEGFLQHVLREAKIPSSP